MRIRTWRGSQHNAWEELCYQLRDELPRGASEVKTGNPDGGVEWYVTRRNGVQWGWQAKFSDDIDSLLGLMERSLRTVAEARKRLVRLTFCIPIDLPDAVSRRGRVSARQRFENAKVSWRARIPGADQIRVELWQGGDVLERLVNHPASRGKQWFFWHEEAFDRDWCAAKVDLTKEAADDRYTPEVHVELPVSRSLDGLARSSWLEHRLVSRQVELERAARRLHLERATGLGLSRELAVARRALGQVLDAVREVDLSGARVIDTGPVIGLIDAATDACAVAHPPHRELRRTLARDTFEIHASGLRHSLELCGVALDEMREFLASDALVAAQRRALLLTGTAGQGKTHLFVDAADRLADGGQPAVALLGGAINPAWPWGSITEALGLPPLGADQLLDAMEAAAQAANAPFVLLIDALNDSSEPYRWADVLPGFLAAVKRRPGYRGAGYGTLFGSLFGMADFGRYVVDSDVSKFTRAGHDEPMPLRDKPHYEGAQDLPETNEELLEPLDLDRLLGERRRWIVPEPPAKYEYPGEEARRWIFCRVIELGWTPERFAAFDERLSSSGRDSHKPERFGKKYQWIALHELLGRLADNYRMREGYDDAQGCYEGPWQFLGRDLDPTLPTRITGRGVDDGDGELRSHSVPLEDESAWWVPAGPSMRRGDAIPQDWGTRNDDGLSPRELLLRCDEDGVRWIVIKSYSKWDDGLSWGRGDEGLLRRDLWIYTFPWLCTEQSTERLVRFLRKRSLMSRWMPEGGTLTNAAYLGEMPWAAAANEWPIDDWQEIDNGHEMRLPPVLPAVTEFFWEGHTLDCSLDEGVRAFVPVRPLFAAGGLKWVPAQRAWSDSTGRVVAQHRETQLHAVLLVDEDWLGDVLAKNGWGLVLGLLGERRLMFNKLTPGFVGGWTEMNALATIRNRRTQVGRMRRERKS